MKSVTIFIGLSMAVTVAFCACGRPSGQQEQSFDEDQIKEALIETNKIVVMTEDQHIEDFIKRYGWQMETTGAGLRFAIIENGNGRKVMAGDIVVLDYTVKLITGDVIYSSAESGYKEFEVGRGGVESGLEEAVLLMHLGDRGRFILPSHLAYGLIGDEHLIPPKSTIIYEVKLIDLK
jgi:FKBP-type peptidyl-prolyl cis-trans isomerase FkpA